MAYVTRDIEDEEEQKQSAPPLSGSTPVSRPGTPMTSAGMPAPQQTPQQQKGTGFTNLDSWLNAGKGRDRSIANAGMHAINTEKNTFGAAARPVETASQDFSTYGTLWDAGTEVDKAATSGDTSGIEKALDQKYEGPREINYDKNNRQNLWDADALSSADTAGSVLGREEMNKGAYSAGAQALDRVLFGADSASQRAMGGVKKDKEAFTGEVDTRTKAATDKVAGLDKAAADANATNRAKLGEYGDHVVKQIDNRVLDATEREKMLRDLLAKDPTLLLAPTSGPTRGDPFETLDGGEIRTISGGGATRENMVSDAESKGLAVLNKLLGTPTVQKTGTYQDLTTSVTKDPNWVPPLKDLGNPRPGTITEMLPGDINDPSTLKGAYYKAFTEYGPKHNGGIYSAVENKEFLDRFRRENPQWADQIPDQAAVEAWEASYRDREAKAEKTYAAQMHEAAQAQNPRGYAAIDKTTQAVNKALQILAGLGG